MKRYSDTLVESLSHVNESEDSFISSPRWKKVKEVLSYRMKVEDPKQCLCDIGSRKFPFFYQLWEAVWYMSWSLKTDFIWNFSQLWPNIKNDKWEINSNYWFLVFHKKNAMNWEMTQYEYALNSLLKDKDSRQAIIHYNQAEHQVETKDFPCTYNQQFFIRDNKLYWVSNMRSNDIIFWLTFDIVWFSLVLQSLYLDLKKTYQDLELWYMIHNAWSFHFYEDFFETVENIIKEYKNWKLVIKDYSIELKKSLNELKELNFKELEKEVIEIKESKDKNRLFKFLEDKFFIFINEVN